MSAEARRWRRDVVMKGLRCHYSFLSLRNRQHMISGDVVEAWWCRRFQQFLSKAELKSIANQSTAIDNTSSRYRLFPLRH